LLRAPFIQYPLVFFALVSHAPQGSIDRAGPAGGAGRARRRARRARRGGGRRPPPPGPAPRARGRGRGAPREKHAILNMKKDKGCNTGRDGPRAPCAGRGTPRARRLSHADSHTQAHASDSCSRIPAVCCIQLGTLPRRSAGGMIAARRSRGATARLMGTRAGVEAVRGGASSAGGGDHDRGEAGGGGASAAEG
jgi:hypothetical protein